MARKSLLFLLIALFSFASVFGQNSRAEEMVSKAQEAQEKGREKEAFDLYKKAANLGNPDAMFGLAGCYHNGLGVAMDSNKAKELYERAAQNDSVGALLTLGMWHDGGFEPCHVPDDKAKSKKYFERVLQLDGANQDAKNFARQMLEKIGKEK